MTLDEYPAGSCERELAETAPEFVTSLRSNEGLNEALYARLVAVLRRCAEEWKEATCIPRLAVNVLVDLQPGMLAAAEAYESEVRDRIADRAIEVGDLVRDTVGL